MNKYQARKSLGIVPKVFYVESADAVMVRKVERLAKKNGRTFSKEVVALLKIATKP